jgi:hypothetical protein
VGTDGLASHAWLQAQAALAGAVVALAASAGEDLLLVALASARLMSLDIGRLDALQVLLWYYTSKYVAGLG